MELLQEKEFEEDGGQRGVRRGRVCALCLFSKIHQSGIFSQKLLF